MNSTDFKHLSSITYKVIISFKVSNVIMVIDIRLLKLKGCFQASILQFISYNVRRKLGFMPVATEGALGVWVLKQPPTGQ